MNKLSVDLSGKTALVTGAFSGLGLHFARTLAASGAQVAMVGRRLELGTRLAAELRDQGYATQAFEMDVTSTASVREALARITETFEAPSIVVNNAGIATSKPALQTEDEDWNAVVDVNLNGAWRIARESARLLTQTQQPGSIINIASILGLRVAQQVPAYAAAKAGLIQLTKALALEFARYRIRVNAIAPGYIATDLNADFFASDAGQALIKRIPQRRLGALDDLDGPLLLLASGASRFMTGSVIAVDGGHTINSL